MLHFPPFQASCCRRACLESSGASGLLGWCAVCKENTEHGTLLWLLSRAGTQPGVLQTPYDDADSSMAASGWWHRLQRMDTRWCSTKTAAAVARVMRQHTGTHSSTHGPHARTQLQVFADPFFPLPQPLNNENPPVSCQPGQEQAAAEKFTKSSALFCREGCEPQEGSRCSKQMLTQKPCWQQKHRNNTRSVS